MRLHRLEMTAFGPFAQRQDVDFDRLSSAGLFLLHGPTGAGKTSVLDAVCFALFGRVPGTRASAGRLRSDHAGADVAASVTCEFTVSGRRFEITRSPEWHRPKKRGAGTVREQAHVVLRERVGEQWVGRASRIDEAADLLDQVIGLGVEQFTKLILLPQGDFAAFLQATPEERRPILQRLFGTDRFAEVERRLAELRRESEHQVRAAQAATDRLLARAEEARLGDEPLPACVDPEQGSRLVTEWTGTARQQLAEARAQVGEAEKVYELARGAADAATEAWVRRRRREELNTALERLLDAEPEQRARRAALEAAGHAGVLAPVLAELAEAETRLQVADERVRAARTGLVEAGLDADGASAQALAGYREELGGLADLLTAEQDLIRLDARAEAGEARIAVAAGQLAATEARIGEWADVEHQLTEERSQAELLSVTWPDRRHDFERATAVAQAVLEHEGVTRDLTAAQDQLRTAVDVHQARVGELQELRTRRLEGMAAELAARLDDDAPCPVCGSAEHPAPARPAGAPVTEQAQADAETAELAAQQSRQQALDTVHELNRRSAGLLALTGGVDAAAAAGALTEADTRLRAAARAGETLRDLLPRLATVAAELTTARAGADQARRTASQQAQELATLAGRRADLRERVERARGEDPDILSRHARISAAVDAVAEWLAAERVAGEAHGRQSRAADAADRAVRAAGFADPVTAAVAVLSDADRARMSAQAATYDTEVQRLRAELANLAASRVAASRPSERIQGAESTDPSSAAGPSSVTGRASAADQQMFDLGDLEVPPDPETLRAQANQARQEHEAARERHTLAQRAVTALAALAAELHRHADETAPLRKHFAVLDAVSKCAEGTGGDNALRMRLSAYVLAARLEQVAEAASDRLAAMSGGRYLLVHTDGPARGGARSGLGLAVVDAWTGVQRDPATLSGGETFCTSLALALGLADVVQAEAGGAAIETLLVDEGFGTLDEQTLDEVMDVLDGLRTAGRAVGLVSHVADLRDRIPTQLEVVKTRTGSRLIA